MTLRTSCPTPWTDAGRSGVRRRPRARADLPLTAHALLAGYRARSFTPAEIVDAVVETIERWEPHVHALAARCLERAREEARLATRSLLRGEPARPLEGVPFVVKDLLDTDAVATVCGSRVLAGRVPDADAAPVARMRAAGAVLVAKAATHELGWGITTVSGHAPPTRNPWARERVAGGSSGGSAVALATGMVPLALGTDTAGSIRIPADSCGILGLRPSRHLVPRAGAFPLAPSLDVVGPLARTPADVRLALGVLAPTWAARAAGATAADLRGVRVGTCADLHPVAADPDRVATLADTVALAADLGAEVRDLRLPTLRESYDVLAAIVLAEGLQTHRDRGLWPQQRDAYGADVRAQLELAGSRAVDEYPAAQAARERIADALASAFEEVDLLIGLSSPTGPAAVDAGPGDADYRRAVMSCTAPQSLAGLPACTWRAGFDRDGLPVGLQITGPAGADAAVLDAVDALQAATPTLQAREPPTPDVGSQ